MDYTGERAPLAYLALRTRVRAAWMLRMREPPGQGCERLAPGAGGPLVDFADRRGGPLTKFCFRNRTPEIPDPFIKMVPPVLGG